MKIEIASRITKTDLLVLPFFAGEKPSTAQKSELESYAYPDFEAKPNEALLLYQKNKLAPRVLLIGLGEPEKALQDTWRQAGGTATKSIKKNIHSITLLPPKEDLYRLSAFIEGFLLGHYRYEDFLRDEKRRLPVIETLTIIIEDKKITQLLQEKIREIQVVIDAVKSVRDMVNSPSNVMNPGIFEHLGKLTAKNGFKIGCKILDEKKLKKLGMWCLYGVGQGAKERPRMIVLEYKYKPKNKRPIVLVGKGICFDSGGINLKTQMLEDMKLDMAGAATVLGIFKILGALRPELHVIGLIPLAENMPSGEAIKSGDILTAFNGITIEVVNTDAEGRLILADALSYGIKTYDPETIIDIATLTGAAITAFGYGITPFLTNSPALKEKIETAAQATDEKMWELPLEKTYRKNLESPIADLLNSNPKAGASTIQG
ncbi:MAG: leucyl aminopeptidase family protein, partial [Candidatus Gracilibacteria bacterium]